jgi:hypothetical protein
MVKGVSDEEIVPGMAEAIERRRLDVGLSKGSLAARAGRSRETLRPVLAGVRRKYDDDTIFGVGRSLRWRNDWYDRLLAGDEPIEADRDHSDLDDRVSRLEEQMKEALSILRRMQGSSPREPGAPR